MAPESKNCLFSLSGTGLDSTSLSNEDRKDGLEACCSTRRDGRLRRRPLDSAALSDVAPVSRTRLVRGRFSFRSGSAGGSVGDVVIDLDLRFRLGVEPGLSSSRALSIARHEAASSAVSCGGGTGCSLVRCRICWVESLKMSRAPCRLAMRRRCCHWRPCRSKLAWCLR